MTVDRSLDHLRALCKELSKLPQETEWVEFKHNNDEAPMIGEYISALANSAAMLSKPSGYMVWGLDDKTHEALGTKFKPGSARFKQQPLEAWLHQKCEPKAEFRFYSFFTDLDQSIVILEVRAAESRPVAFDGVEYIRVGSVKKKLKDFPEKERQLWLRFDQTAFELQTAAADLSADQVFKLLDYPTYFDLLGLPLPEARQGILDQLVADQLIRLADNGLYEIKNLGAILFARRLKDFPTVARKTVRLIHYEGNNRIQTKREIEGVKGYAVGFEGLIETLTNMLPVNEVIGKAFRREVAMFPELALRELIANAIIHQDFTLRGTGPMVELFDHRIEITNPGVPLVDTARFLDSPPQSRNESLASFMRRIKICEERGSGVDKVIGAVEFYQLPAPLFERTDQHTRVTLFAHKDLKDMSAEDRSRACYQHCCLKYVSREVMNNTTVRERFAISEANSAQASRIIKQTSEAGLIRLYDETANRRDYRYVPYWA